jgi:predicted Zn-dependent peptidase
VHPYRVPIIGWMTDLENMTVSDARAWYDDWYAPNNAYVVVVGDVDHRRSSVLPSSTTASCRRAAAGPEAAGRARHRPASGA